MLNRFTLKKEFLIELQLDLQGCLTFEILVVASNAGRLLENRSTR